MITEHTICFLPASHRDWRYFAIKVQRRGNGMWVLNWGEFYRSRNPNAVDGWYPGMGDALEFTEADALALADDLAPTVDLGGLTAADVLERSTR